MTIRRARDSTADSRELVVTGIAGHDRQPVLQGGCRDDQVRLRKRMADLPAVFDEEAPLEHDILGDFKYALIEHGSHSVQQPVIQLGAANRIVDRLDAVSDFSERDGADEQVLEPFASDEASHARIGARSTQLRNHIGIEQPAAHSLTARTGIAERCGSISISRCGDACSASINNSPVCTPFRRLNSSASTTTTASRPCTVTCCGPSLCAMRTSSLNRALAS